MDSLLYVIRIALAVTCLAALIVALMSDIRYRDQFRPKKLFLTISGAIGAAVGVGLLTFIV